MFLDCGQISEIDPLHRFLRSECRARNIEAIARGHDFEFLQGAELLGHFFTQANHVLGKVCVIQFGEQCLAIRDQAINAIQRDAAIVANNPAPAIGIRQTGNNPRFTRGANFRIVAIEGPLVMVLAITIERLFQRRIQRIAVGIKTGFNHANTGKRHDGAFERLIGLQTDNQLLILQDITRAIGGDAGADVGADIQYAVGAFLFKQRDQCVPDCVRALGRALQKRGITMIGGDVIKDKSPYINRFLPIPRMKTFPGIRSQNGTTWSIHGEPRCSFAKINVRFKFR